MNKRYNSINPWLFKRFGERVFKVSLENGCPCPNRDGTLGTKGCIYCNPKGYFPATAPERGGRGKPISEQLREGIEYIGRRHGARRVISYFQSGSNTNAPANALAPIFEEAIAHPAVVGLAVSTRPDCIEVEHIDVFRRLARKTFLWVELGLQSCHDETLRRIGRGHDAESFLKAWGMLSAAGIPVCAHVILGLPGETREMMTQTACFLSHQPIWGIKIHNLHVLSGTELERQYRTGAVSIPSLDTYAGWVADVLEVLGPAIVVHRVNGHSPRGLTIAPAWSVNKLAILNAVEREMERRDSWQGKYCVTPRRPSRGPGGRRPGSWN